MGRQVDLILQAGLILRLDLLILLDPAVENLHRDAAMAFQEAAGRPSGMSFERCLSRCPEDKDTRRHMRVVQTWQ